MVPSRELAMQIVRVGQGLLPHEARGCVQQAIGGANMARQVMPVCRSCTVLLCLCCMPKKELFQGLNAARAGLRGVGRATRCTLY